MRNKIHEAIRFAVDHYIDAGVGFDGNFFMPPMEMLSILNNMNMAGIHPELMIAGVLYHVVEDTDATLEMITEQFGYETGELVGKHLGYLYLGWYEGNQKMVAEMKDADMMLFKVLILCDTVVKLRKLTRELHIRGEETWGRQGTSKEQLCTYFSRIQDQLCEMQFDEVAAPTYWEMVDRFKDVFISFYYDRESQRIFQVSMDMESYAMGRADLQWKPWNEKIPENAICVGRKYAERIEDNWGEEYDMKQQSSGIRFEEYFTAVKKHLRGFLKDMAEEDLDVLMIAGMDYIKLHYDADIARLQSGEIVEDIFRKESPAKTADGLERLVGCLVDQQR